jgi:hypothetical protein
MDSSATGQHGGEVTSEEKPELSDGPDAPDLYRSVGVLCVGGDQEDQEDIAATAFHFPLLSLMLVVLPLLRLLNSPYPLKPSQPDGGRVFPCFITALLFCRSSCGNEAYASLTLLPSFCLTQRRSVPLSPPPPPSMTFHDHRDGARSSDPLPTS